jgi:iron complex transport system substrate-binding protein
VVVPAEVRRVVATVPGLVETVVALGAADLLVAVPAAGALPEEAEGVRRIPTYPTIPAEMLAEAAPDLVLVDPTLSPRDEAPLRARFALFAADSRSLDGLRATFLALGTALAREEAAARLAADLEAARAEAEGRAGGARVLAVTGGRPLHALGPGSLLHDLLAATGARNVAAGIDRPSRAVADEQVREWAPDWIVVAGGPAHDVAERFPSVPAVASGRVLDASGDEFARAGPRTAKALRALARALSGETPPSASREAGR